VPLVYQYLLLFKMSVWILSEALYIFMYDILLMIDLIIQMCCILNHMRAIDVRKY